MGRTLLTEHEAATVLQAAARGRLQRKIAATAPPRKKVEHGKVATMMHRLQANAVPLQLGIVLALLWANLHPDSYERILGTRADTIRLWPGANLFGHPLTIHYLINDGFMVLFFGIAAKEVTESCLPGGSLNPPSKALSPLVATIGGVGGPILVYLLMTHLFWSAGAFANHTTTDTLGAGDDLHIGHHRQLAAVAATTAAAGNSSLRPVTYAEIAHGWGVPTATDISLAWVVAAQVFPLRHPAIDFLLLLAVADDAIGLVIIATVYVDPLHPVEPVWMLLLAVAVAVAASLRRLSLQHWMWYLLLAGLPAWIGLSKARLHPALALCFVVPAMPSKPPLDRPNQLPTLQAFEHSLKGVVDCKPLPSELGSIRLLLHSCLTFPTFESWCASWALLFHSRQRGGQPARRRRPADGVHPRRAGRRQDRGHRLPRAPREPHGLRATQHQDPQRRRGDGGVHRLRGPHGGPVRRRYARRKQAAKPPQASRQAAASKPPPRSCGVPSYHLHPLLDAKPPSCPRPPFPLPPPASGSR